MNEPDPPAAMDLPASGVNAPPPRRPREPHRTFRCRRCKGELTFPTGYSARHRAPVVFCRKCGAQTKLPMQHRWVWAVIGATVFFAAWAFVIVTWLREGGLEP